MGVNITKGGDMENLEEMKKRIADFKKRNTYTQKYSSYAIITSLRIFDLVFDRLMLRNKKSTMPSTIEMNFLVSLINRKEPFTIEGIRLDLLAGMPISDVAMKYCEPQEVIVEILERDLRSEEDIVASKIYNAKELCIAFKRSIFISGNCVLINTSNKSKTDFIHWWTGDVLMANYVNIINSFNKKTESAKIDNKKYITVKQAAELLKIGKLCLADRIRSGQNIFGVKLHFKKIKLYGKSVSKSYLPLDAVNEAKSNIKYYIKHPDFFNYGIIPNGHKESMRKLFLKLYHKKIDFSSHYLRKESLENYITLTEQYGYKREDLIKRNSDEG